MIPIIEDGILPLDGKVKFPEIRVHETKTGHVADTLINGKWKYFTYDGMEIEKFKVVVFEAFTDMKEGMDKVEIKDEA